MGAKSHDVHIDALLSQMAIGYRPEGFIADQLFPLVNVAKQSDGYTIFSRADRTRRQETKRAPASRANRVEESVSTDTYFCKNYALSAAVTIEDKSNADPIFLDQLYEGKTRLVMDHLMLDYEKRVALQVNSTSNVGSSAAVSSGWNGAGDPLGDINTAIDNVHYANGVMPNRIVFGLEAWKSFRRDSTVRNIIFGSNNGGGYPSLAQVRELLEIPNIYVGGGFENTAEENIAESLSTIWGDNVLVYYAPQSPSMDQQSYGYSFRWSRPGLPNMAVERHPFDSREKSEDVEVGYYQDEKITGQSLAFLLTAVNSST